VLDAAGSVVQAADVRIVDTAPWPSAAWQPIASAAIRRLAWRSPIMMSRSLTRDSGPQRRDAVALTAGRSVRIDFHLQLGETRESVTVVESQPWSASPPRIGELQWSAKKLTPCR